VSPWQGGIGLGNGEVGVVSSNMSNAIILTGTKSGAGVWTAGLRTCVHDGAIVTGGRVAIEVFLQCEAEGVAVGNVALEGSDVLVFVFSGTLLVWV